MLILWFLLFSVLPLAFVTVYSMMKYEKALDRELSQRLAGNAREISVIFDEYRSNLQQKRDHYVNDANLIYHLSVNDRASIEDLISQWLRQDFTTSLTVFARDGRMLVSVFKDEKGEIRTFAPTSQAVFLNANYLATFKTEKEVGSIEFTNSHETSLLLSSRVKNNAGRIVGYLQQGINLDKGFLNRLKTRLKLEIIFLKDNGELMMASHPDFYLYKKDFFAPYMKSNREPFFDLNLRTTPYGFLLYPLVWEPAKLYVALGASKGEAKEVLKNVNFAFISVVAVIILILIITILVTSSWVLKPLYELVEALQQFETTESTVEIPVKNDTEIGLLTASFNEMSRRISQARNDLKKKIFELEAANQELKDTQAKLVHSAKMISLGQLVAGVAHELNNPIGFIYSNMAHLRDYSEKLIKLVGAAETSPQELPALKEEFEFDYIVQDMPKLISSCEDGARRTKDIVLGLRNFSRLEEAKLKEINIHEALDNTLSLLAGEIKNRVEIHRLYEPIPNVSCYASQINQVFMNILSNALHAIEGPGHIWISTMAMKNTMDKVGKVQISIQDSGKGMTPAMLEKIFDPFFTTKGVGQGTGLGLSISYGILESHGGEILVRSEVDVGTEFILLIPVYPPANRLVSPKELS
jgi:two-component system NtrC family sensor kinase